MATQVEELGGDRVRLTVEVPADDIHHAIEHATNDLAGRVKVPGFRKGKVPTQVLVSKIGRDAVYSEAVDSHIGNWFWKAVTSSRVRPVGAPEYAYELPKSSSEDWRFSAEFVVQARPDLVDWKKLDVARRTVEVPDEAVTKELAALQRTVGDLSPIDSRTAQPGDVAVVDIVSDGGFGQRNYVFELGGERMVDEIETAVRGMLPTEVRDVSWELDDGARRNGAVTLNELHEKVLPPLDDDLAKSVSEFETLAELRAQIVADIRKELEHDADLEFKWKAVDELAKASNVDPEGLLVEIRTRELLSDFVRTLQRRGIDPNEFLRMTGQTVEELEGRLRTEAKQTIARELVLEVAADRLKIEVSDDEIRAELHEQGETDDDIEEFFERGGADRVRPDLRMKKALARIVDEVKPISEGQADAREAIWTPEKAEKEKGKKKKAKKLWTPGSKEE